VQDRVLEARACGAYLDGSGECALCQRGRRSGALLSTVLNLMENTPLTGGE
jgi:hypothetical protein